MADITYQISPRVATHTVWTSENPTLGKSTGGKTYGGVVISTGSVYGTILVYGQNQSYNTAYAAGQFAPLGVESGLLTKRKTAAQWTSANPTLLSGEIGLETDTGKMKMGDGSTDWTSLDYNILAGVIYIDSSGNIQFQQSNATGSSIGNGIIIEKNGTVGYEILTSGGTQYQDIRFNVAGSLKGRVRYRPNTESIAFMTNGTDWWQIDSAGDLKPVTDNAVSLGGASFRPDVLYAVSGTINTSDAREKTEFKKLTKNEIEAAKELSNEIGSYQWLDSIEKKGIDQARTHIGLTVQKAIEVMKKHNLNPFKYGFICYDEWEDEIQPAYEETITEIDKETGKKNEKVVKHKQELTLKAGNRYGFRYDQLNVFLAAGFNARLEALEALE